MQTSVKPVYLNDQFQPVTMGRATHVRMFEADENGYVVGVYTGRIDKATEIHGEAAGHTYRGNQYDGGRPGGGFPPGDERRNENFRTWFGASKVVDSSGKPQPVFHGSAQPGFDSFDPLRQDHGALYGPGFYFTESPVAASGYASKTLDGTPIDGGAVYKTFLTIKNPINMDASLDSKMAKKILAGLVATGHDIDSIPEGSNASLRSLFTEIGKESDAMLARDYSGTPIKQALYGRVPKAKYQEIFRAAGFDGITHIGGDRMGRGVHHRVWIAFEPTQVKSAVGDSGAFDPKDPIITHGEAAGHPFRGNQYTGSSVTFEVAPDPNDHTLTDEWKSLPETEKLAISEKIAREMVPGVLASMGAKGTIRSQVGSYLDDTNPSFTVRLAKSEPDSAAKLLGFGLSQDSVITTARKPFQGSSKVGAVSIDIGGKTPAQIADIYAKLRAIKINGEQVVSGQSTVAGKMTVLNFSNAHTADLATAIDSALRGKHRVEVRDVHAAFPSKEDYDYASVSNVGQDGQGSVRRRALDFRARASAALRKEMAARRKEAGAKEEVESHGEASGHPFRGNQYTGGKDGVQASESESVKAWDSSAERTHTAKDAVDTLKMLHIRKDRDAAGRGAGTRYKMGQWLTMDPKNRGLALGPKQWKDVERQAIALKEIVVKTNLEKEKLQAELSNAVDAPGFSAAPGHYRDQQIDRLIGPKGDYDRKALLIEALDDIAAIARDGQRRAKAHKAVKEEKDAAREESVVEKFPGLSEVKMFKTAAAAEASLSDIAWRPKLGDAIHSGPGLHGHGPMISLAKMDPRIASMVADEIRSLHDEFGAQFSKLGYFGPRTRADGTAAANMAVYHPSRVLVVGDTLGPNERIHKVYDRVNQKPGDVLGVEMIVDRMGKSRPLAPGTTHGQVPSILFNGTLFSSMTKAYDAHGVESSSDFHDGMKDLRSTVRHEFGHHIDHMAKAQGFRAVAEWKQKWIPRAREISGYSAKNGSELFAEAFAAMKYGDTTRKSHPAVVELSVIMADLRKLSGGNK